MNKNDFILRLSKINDNKEYENEENCIFQLISNKKNEFINFFGEIIINFPGFMTIYKDKFFAKLNEFIGDKNYIEDLKSKCYDISLNYKYIEEIDEKYLGNKRRREKVDNGEMSKYDNELKLLESDYPLIKEDEINNIEETQIKKEKEPENISISKSNNSENKKKRKLEYKNKSKNKEIPNNNINININEKKKIEINNNINNDIENNEKEDTNKNIIKIMNFKDNNQDNIEQKQNFKFKSKRSVGRQEKNKNIFKEKKFESPRNIKYFSPVKGKDKDNLSLSVHRGKPKIISINDISSINNMVSNDNSFSTDDFFMSEISDYSNKPSSFGINSRLDRMPKINIPKKKKNLINFSSESLLDGIKEKLINKGINSNSRNNSKKNISENCIKNEQITNLQKLVNSNFYGPENKNDKSLKNSISVKNDESSDNIEKFNNRIIAENSNNKVILDNECEMKEKDNNEKSGKIFNTYDSVDKEIEVRKIKNKNNNRIIIENEIELKEYINQKNLNNFKCNKTLKKKINKEHKDLRKSRSQKMKIIPKCSKNIPINENKNGNLKILNTFEFHYIRKNEEKIIKKVEEIPYIIIVQKNYLNMSEIKDYFSKKRINNSDKKKDNLSICKEISKEITNTKKSTKYIPIGINFEKELEEYDINRNELSILEKEKIEMSENKLEKKEKKRRGRPPKKCGSKEAKIIDEEKKIKNGNKEIKIREEENEEDDDEANNLSNICTIRSNCSNEEEEMNIQNSKDKSKSKSRSKPNILQEKTFYEEDLSNNEIKRKNYIQNKNKKDNISDIDQNLNTVDVLNGFDYLYQQKSQ